MTYSDDIPAPANSARYQPDEIILYGVKLNKAREEAVISCFSGMQFFFGVMKLELINQVVNEIKLDPDAVAIAVAYGYSFEGHCYRLDKPKLVIFPYGVENAARGCGFEGPEYRMWRISSKQQILELTTNLDLAESLILEGNLPGNRAPNTYGNSMQLAHRSGKLNRNGGGS